MVQDDSIIWSVHCAQEDAFGPEGELQRTSRTLYSSCRKTELDKVTVRRNIHEF